MSYIELGNMRKYNKVIMIFAEGTILKPKSIFSLYNHNAYVPIGDSVNIIKQWQEQGAEIVYCTSRKNKQAQDIACLMDKFGFVGTRLYYRSKKERYKDIVEQVKPDVLIEDDCRNIGGKWQMCITYVKSEIKNTINSIVVREFKGIDALPRKISEL